MLHHFFSVWRQLLGMRPQQPAEKATERRLWVRYPLSLETSCRPAQSPARFSVCLRDISRGGVSLLTDRPLSAGEFLVVELPGPQPERPLSALACVVHVRPQAGQWLVGCAFASELTDADLAAFGAQRRRPANGDQRAWERCPCQVQAHYQLATVPDAPRTAQVLNLSPRGAALLVAENVENGNLLNLHLRPAAGGQGKTMLACVVHVQQLPEQQWILGCNFITELTESELLSLL